MGSGGAKQTNQLLGQQTNRVNALEQELGGRSGAAYQQQGDLRNELLGNYRGLYSNALGSGGGSSGGGGGGPEWSSSSMPFYQEAMNTGLYSPERQGQTESYATGPITGMYEGLMRNIAQQRAGRGLTNYGSGLGSMALDRGYAMGNAALGAKIGINREIDTNRFQGAGGVTGLESEKRAYERSRAASAASGASADRAYQMAILGRMEGLMPEDLPYIDRQLASNQMAFGGVNSRQNETPLWQRTLSSVVPAAASAAAGAFMPTSYAPPAKKRSTYTPSSSYYDPYMEG